MTGFDHLVVGTSEQQWASDPRLRGVRDLATPRPGDRVLVIAAHPDDETLGAGGVIAACARNGVAVSVVVASDGEASHPRSTTWTPAALATRRRTEVLAAVERLAPDVEVRFLGLPDGELDRHPAALEAQIAYFARGATHLISPWVLDRHPDHEACGTVAAQIAADLDVHHWQYPIWAWHWADPGGADLPYGRLGSVRLEPRDVAAKAEALRCHVSQHSPLSDAAGDEAILPPRLLEHFTRAAEYFVVDAPAGRPGYFDSLYRDAADPWGLENRFYEQRKRDLTIAVLPRPRFRRAFEPGCAIGLLTERLAARCDEVLACDVSARAVEQAGRRTASLPGVRVEQRGIPHEWPDGRFDLMVLAEVGYYCPDLTELLASVLGGLAEDGVVVGCHWRHPAPEHPHTAEAVHAVFDEHLHSLVRHAEEDFILQVWSRSAASVAAADGIIG